MKLDIFEGFKRLNQIVIISILIVGSIFSFNNDDATIYKVIHPVGGESCISRLNDSLYLDKGNVSIAYCFDDVVDDSFMNGYIAHYNIPEFMKNEWEKELNPLWTKELMYQLGITILFAFCYFLLCSVIKYIALGFIKNKPLN